MTLDDTVGAVAERPPAAQRAAGSIPPRNKYLYGRVWLLSCLVCDFSTSLNAPMLEELYNKQKKTYSDIHNVGESMRVGECVSAVGFYTLLKIYTKLE